MKRVYALEVIKQSFFISSESNMRHKVALEILVSGYIEAYIEFFNITGFYSV